MPTMNYTTEGRKNWKERRHHAGIFLERSNQFRDGSDSGENVGRYRK